MRAILDQLPARVRRILRRHARAPYGPRPIAQTREFALQCLDRLVDHGVKVLVIACNTASAAVLHDARERYDVPVVEVIRPAVRRAAAATRSGRVGVICTGGTHQSGAYLDAFAAAPHLDVTSTPCPRFVEFVEAGVTGGAELVGVAHDYLDPLRERGVDTVVLGCTHYPLLTGVISYVMGDDVTLVSSAEETAKDVYRVLADAACCGPTTCPRRTTGSRPPATRRSSGGSPVRFLGVGSSVGPVFTSPPTVAAGGARMRLTVIGCSGSFAGPGVAGVLLPRRGRARGPHLAASCSTSAAARSGPCSATSTRPRPRRGRSSATSTRTTASDLLGLYVLRRYRPDGPLPQRLPVHGPGAPRGAARADVPRPRAGRDGERVRLLDGRRRRAAFTVGPFPVIAVRGRTTRSRPTATGSRPTGSSSRSPATPTTARTSTRCSPVPTWPCSTRPSSTAATSPATSTSRGRGPRGRRAAGGVRPAGAHPRPGVERPRGVPRPGRRGLAGRGRGGRRR